MNNKIIAVNLKIEKKLAKQFIKDGYRKERREPNKRFIARCQQDIESEKKREQWENSKLNTFTETIFSKVASLFSRTPQKKEAENSNVAVIEEVTPIIHTKPQQINTIKQINKYIKMGFKREKGENNAKYIQRCEEQASKILTTNNPAKKKEETNTEYLQRYFVLKKKQTQLLLIGYKKEETEDLQKWVEKCQLAEIIKKHTILGFKLKSDQDEQSFIKQCQFKLLQAKHFKNKGYKKNTEESMPAFIERSHTSEQVIYYNKNGFSKKKTETDRDFINRCIIYEKKIQNLQQNQGITFNNKENLRSKLLKGYLFESLHLNIKTSSKLEREITNALASILDLQFKKAELLHIYVNELDFKKVSFTDGKHNLIDRDSSGNPTRIAIFYRQNGDFYILRVDLGHKNINTHNITTLNPHINNNKIIAKNNNLNFQLQPASNNHQEFAIYTVDNIFNIDYIINNLAKQLSKTVNRTALTKSATKQLSKKSYLLEELENIYTQIKEHLNKEQKLPLSIKTRVVEYLTTNNIFSLEEIQDASQELLIEMLEETKLSITTSEERLK